MLTSFCIILAEKGCLTKLAQVALSPGVSLFKCRPNAASRKGGGGLVHAFHGFLCPGCADPRIATSLQPLRALNPD